MTAFLGTFVAIKTMADGCPRVTLDLQCTLAEFAALGLMPGVPFGIARITGESSIAPVEPEPEPKAKIGPLCLLACQFCESVDFQRWVNQTLGGLAPANAKDAILRACGIASRKDLDTSPDAAARFHSRVRVPFMAWRDAP